ncbi:MAG: hypothetical protein JF615_07050 [Asticcacaulis sp.]|nr:hypothetical protein [Asticcacaulis sp.]
MSFGQITMWIFLAGCGMPFFFMPLIAISMGAVRPEETASASGLQNFIRTMSGAVATSFVTTTWENNANANHQKLVEHMGDGARDALTAFDNSGLPPGGGERLLDNLVQGQAVMLSTNEIFMGAAIVFALCAFLAWTLPKPRGAVDMSGAH